VCSGPVVDVLDYQSRDSGFKFQPRQKFGSSSLPHLCPIANLAMMSTLTVRSQWEGETVRERPGHSPSYAEAKKMKSLAFHTHGRLRDSLPYVSDLLLLIWVLI